MRKLLFCLAVAAALAVPAAASAREAPPPVICGTDCDGGPFPGWTGCTQVTGDESGGVWGIAGWHHYLVVSYCKNNGLITQLSIVAHGCDTSGFAFCHLGPAWVEQGGVGDGWAYVTGRAYYGTTINQVTGLSYTSAVYVWIPYG